MLSCWPIKKKLTLSLTLLLIALAVLSISGIRGIYKYRGLAPGVSRRSIELPLAAEFAQHVSNLRVTLSCASPSPALPLDSIRVHSDRQVLRHDFQHQLSAAQETIKQYRDQLLKNQRMEETDWRTDTNLQEGLTLHKIETALESVAEYSQQSEDWVFGDVCVDEIEQTLEELQSLSKELPSFLQLRMSNFKDGVQGEYRTAIVLTWITSVTALLVLGLLVRLLNVWVLQPFRALLHGSRRVAAGDFDHRIHLTSQDEMAELAHAMNNMTQRFQEIRDDLDQKVQQRTKEVVRSEQLASVGFLAAGVAHEINNPLASIAVCAESLEERLHEVIQHDDALPDELHRDEVTIVRNYLRMIQDEAFRCKQITERLLDFARIGEVQLHAADLTDIVAGVIEMVGHLGKYKEKHIYNHARRPVIAAVNPQEFKQVTLNLLTNALDSLDRGGSVHVDVTESDGQAELTVHDDGCGMTEEVRQHLFEPFFTRHRGGQGTGLGLSITYRIVSDHGGTIAVQSEGVGKGSQLVVRLPLATPEDKEPRHPYKAA